MSDVNIDKLQIEVEASAEKAESNLDKLIKKLQNFSQTIRKTTGLDRISKQIDKINESVNRITGTAKLEKLTATIDKLKNMQSPNVTKTVNAIKRLAEASNSIGSISGTEKFASNIQAISEACKPMENMGKNTLAPFLNSLKKIPEITEKLDTSTIKEFADRIKSLTAGLSPLTTEVQKSEKGLTALNSIIKATTASNGNLASSNAAATRSFTSLGGILNSIKVKFAAYGVIGHKVGSIMSECFDSSNDYVENLNLFSVTMGEAADSALEYAQTVNDLLGIDVSEWIRNQGVFKQITSGFGVATEKANLMSQNLTQIGYDIASFFNIDTEDAMLKVQSGISGELEPLRRLGYALDTATLQQIAYNNGITQSINTMTQAQKSQLRYIAILQQSTNVMGDMARTIVTPANSMRILGQQIEQLKRAFGNIVSVIAAKVIPYIQVAVRLLTDLENYLADKMGFELPKIDYSGVSDGISSVTDSAEEATEAISQTAEELNWLAGFDEITKIPSADNNSSSSDDSALNNFDLGIDLPEYDFLKDLDAQTNDLYEQVKKQLQDLYKWWQKHKTIIKTIAGLLAGLWVADKVKKFISKIKDLKKGFDDLKVIKTAKDWLKNFTDGFKKARSDGDGLFTSLNKGAENFRSKLSKTTKFLGTIVGAVVSSYGSYNLFKDLTTDTANWKSVLGDSALIVGGLGMSWLFGGGAGLAVGIITTAVAGLAGAIKGVDDKILEADKAFADSLLYNNGGLTIDTFTDAFENQFGYISNLNGVLSDYDQKISDIDGSISNEIQTLENFQLSLGGTKEFSDEKINEIKKTFESLTTDMQTKFGFNTDKVFAAFRNQSMKTAEKLGYDVGEMTTILNDFQKEFNTTTDDLNSRAQTIIDDISSGTATDADIEELNSIMSALMDLNICADEEQLKFKDTVASFADIDFESEETFVQKMEELKTSYDTLMGTIDDNYYSVKASIETLKLQSEAMYEHGFLPTEKYEANLKVCSSALEIIETDYKNNKNSLKQTMSGTLNAINNEYENAMALAESNATATIKEGFQAVLETGFGGQEEFNNNLHKIVSERTRNGSSVISDTLSDMFKYVGADIDRNEGAKFMYDKMQENGSNASQGLANGISGASQAATNAMSLLGLNIVRSSMIALGEHSPSKKTYQHGVWLVQGLTNGIFSQQIPMLATIISTAKSAVSTFNSNIDVTFAGEFADTFISGIRANKASIVNEIVDMFNEILDRTDTFNVKLMDTFNSAIPQFQSMGNTLASLAGSASMQISGINYTAPGYRLQYDGEYASGGFPKKHQLFIARENGIPEMVGRIGNQTAVANNDQITEAIFKAVYSAVKEGSNDSNVGSGSSSKQPIYIMTPNNKVLMKAVVDEVNGEIRRTGKSPIKST
ncbi:MAG: hypothetical protein Q4E74_07995 [Ruminococcus sp.]|nr:hypothetical protein [Ruminococcus sp.]